MQTKWSPFHSLALSVQIPFMDKLLQSGFDIDAVDKVSIIILWYWAPALWASLWNRAWVDLVKQDGFTALHKAVIGKKEAVISHLLRKGANPHVRNKVSKTLPYSNFPLNTIIWFISKKLEVMFAPPCGRMVPPHCIMRFKLELSKQWSCWLNIRLM